jgi:hypothetical protein
MRELKVFRFLKITIKNKLQKAQSYFTHDYRNFPLVRQPTLLCVAQIAGAICMGVCRVRDGGGEKRGKKRELRGEGG